MVDVSHTVLSKPRLVGVDFDGTCANPDPGGNCRVPTRIRTAVQNADRSKTASIALVTGRPVAGAKWGANALGLRNGVVMAEFGAVVCSAQAVGGRNVLLRELRLGSDVAWRCLQLAEIHGCYFKIQDIEGATGLRHSDTAARYSRYVHTPLDVVDLGEMKSCTERGALAALLFATSPPMAAEIVGSLRTDFGDTIDITVTAVGRIEVRDAGATKGEAMRWLCESYLDIPVNEQAAIGDGPADAAMLAAVGTGIAVRSDRTDVAQLFREAVATCDTPERGGVADALSAMGIVNQRSTPDGSNSGASELDC